MKRILAFLLCWTMLLSQLVMLAEAAKMQEQSDILYLEENGITVEDGGQVFMDNAPLGRSDDVERYSPSVPKFIPEALKNLGLAEPDEEQTEEAPSTWVDTGQGTGPAVPTYRATIKSDKVMMYGMPRADAESIYLKGCAGKEVELIKTDSYMWFYMNDVNDACQEGYAYVYAEDVILADRIPYRGINASASVDRNEVAVEIVGAPTDKRVALREVDASRAPKRRWSLDGGVRTLLASCAVELTNPDGSVWHPDDGPVEVNLTLPEIPELDKWDKIYVEQVDKAGNVKTIPVSRYFLTNVIFFETDTFSEFFVYCVDYPENADEYLAMLELDEFVWFSDLYSMYGDPEKPFGNIEDISFSQPEKVRIEKVYNDKNKVGDWRIMMLEPLYETGAFTVQYKRNPAKGNTRWTEVYIDASGEDLPKTLTAGNKYFVAINLTHTGDIAATSNSNICLGAKNGAGKKLTMNGRINVSSGDTLYFTVNTGVTSNSQVIRADAHNTQLVHVSGGATLIVNGGEDDGKQKVIFDGDGDDNDDNEVANEPLLSVTNNSGNVCKLENCTIRESHNDGGGTYLAGGFYFGGGKLYIGHNVWILNNYGLKGAGLYLGSGAAVESWDGDHGKAKDNPLDIQFNSAEYGDQCGGGIYMVSGASFKAYLSSLSYNYAGKYGGGIYMESGTTFAPKLSGNFNMNGNWGPTHGGGVYMAGGTMTVNTGGTFYIGNSGTSDDGDDRNNMSDYGAGIFVRGTSIINGSGELRVRYNYAANNGGGIQVENSKLTIDGSVTFYVYSNTAATGYGGGIVVNNYDGSTAAELVESTTGLFQVSSNTAETYGGGIYCDGKMSTDGSGNYLVYSNTAKKTGGGIFNDASGDSTGTITFIGAKIYSNTANESAGGIYNDGVMTFKTTKSEIYENAAKGGNGGGIASVNSTGKLTFNIACSITKNTASGNGGGIYVDNSTFTVASGLGDCELDSNKATNNGGGMYVNSGTVTWNSKFFVRTNTATNGSGGGIYNNSGAVTLSVLSMCGNSAKNGNGGGIYNNATLSFNGGGYIGSWNDLASDSGNKAKNGGGIYQAAGTFTIASSTKIGHNKATNGSGGGIYVAGGTLSLSGGPHYIGAYQNIWDGYNKRTEGNEATAHGGGIYIAGGEIKVGCQIYVSENKGTTANSSNGGGVCIVGGTLTVDADIGMNIGPYTSQGTYDFDGNSAHNGGGIYMSGGTIANNGTVNIKENKATNWGGGICIINATASFTNFTVDSNTTSLGHGGGIFIYDSTTTSTGSYKLTLNNCNITNNHCDNSDNATSDTDRGAGIYAERVDLEINGGSVSENYTDYGTGGGIFYRSNAQKNRTMTISGCEIAGNVATGNGGGLLVEGNSTLEITNSVVSGNYAGATKDSNGNISTSATGGSGGGICLVEDLGGKQPSFKSTGTLTVSNNTATTGDGGGICVKNATTFEITGDNSTIFGNSAGNNGGGIYSALALTLGGNVTVGHETDAAKGNSAGNHGGGIYCALDVTLTDAKVYHNSAGGNGGGICVVDGKKVSFAGTCQVDGNSAGIDGGGVYINTGTITTENTTAMSFTGNRAGHSGGGIFISEATATLTNATFTDNLAGHCGGAIYGYKTELVLNSANPFSGNMSGTVLNANGEKVTSELGGNGGAIYFDGNNKTSLSLTGTELKNNMARRVEENQDGHGGAIYAINCAVTLTGDVRIHGNTSECNGGGINLYDATLSSTASGGKTPHIYSNTALQGGGILVGGASVLTQDWSALALTVGGGTAEAPLGNTANLGGGLFFDGINMTIGPNVNIHYNKATADGGGILIKSKEKRSPTLTVKAGTEISYNTADRDGGGIHSNVSHVTLEAGVKILHNAAGRNGGGINVQRERKIDTELTFPVVTLGGTGAQTLIQNNNATKQGGGIYIICGHLYATNTDVSHNVSGAMGGGILAASYTDAGLDLAEMVLQFENGNLSDNTSGQNAGGAYAEGYGKLKIHNTTIARNKTAGDGGGLLLSMKTYSPTITDCTIDSNVAGLLVKDGKNYGNGGGIRMYTMNSAPVLTNTSITNNVAYLNGGGISIESAPLKLDSTNTVSGNYAGAVVSETRAVTATASENGGNGGAIYFTGSGRTLTLQGATINNNHALSSGVTNGNGGGIYMNAGTKLAVIGNSNPTAAGVESSYIIGNTATNNGGGLYVAGGSEETAASKIDIATGIPTKVGGNNHEVDLMVGDDNESTGNHAANGGGIYLSGGFVTLTGDHELYVRQNTATADGGAMVLNGTTLTIEKIGAVVSGNTADGNGGAIAVMSNATMKETSMARFNIFRNIAKINGGGIWCAGKIETNGMRIGYMTATEKNYAPNRAVDGGGLYLTENGSFIATDYVYVANNEASGNGGGIYTKVALTVNSYLLVGYLATATNVETECGNVAKYGGGIYIDGATVTLNGATVQYNRAEQDGGGIYVKVGTANLNGAIIDSNYAGISKSIDISQIEAEGFDYSTIDGGYGGGVYVAEGAAMTMNDGAISNNGAYAEAAERGDGYGGGLFVATDATATLQSGTISKNYAYGKDNYSLTAMGGGVYTEGTVTFTGNFTITKNTSSRYGGGFYQTNGNAITTVNAGVEVIISNNTADLDGGGIAFGNGDGTKQGAGEFTAEGTLKVENNTARHGGGVYMANGSLSLKSASTIANNTAGTSGGGICMDGAETMSVKLEGSSQITGNTAGGNGGGVWMNNGTLTLDGKDVAVTSNYAQNGGGVYMNDGVLKMNGSAISNHSLTKKDATSKITHGGGICLKGGDLILNGATIQNNEVAGNGGGIYMTGGTLTDTVEDSTVQSVTQITGNKSDRNGGGLYCENVDVSLSHTIFDGNVATATMGSDKTYHGGCGGGIFFTNTNGSLNTLTLSGVELQNNMTYSVAVVNDGKTEHIGGRGGAIAVENSNLLIKGATSIHNNYAQRNGGGVHILRKDNDGTTEYAFPRMTVDGTAEQYIRIQNNTAGHQGGGLYVYGSHFDASYMDLYHNTSANHGGGMLLVSYESDPETKIPNLTLSEMECRLEHCEITSNISGAHAGGAWIEGYQHEDVQISDTNMTGNWADNNGGALYLRYTKLTLAGTNVIAENRAGVSVTEEEATSGYYDGGGGIFVHEDSELTVNAGTTISNNFAVEAGTNRGSGGGIYATSASGSDTKVYILGGDIFINTAKYGAGIYATNAEVHLSGGGLYSNTATNTGGGVYLYNASLAMTGGEIQANSAWKFGGGIYVGEESTLTVSGFDKSPIRNNTAGIMSGENANWNEAAGNDIFALGKGSTVTMPATKGPSRLDETKIVDEYWFADYAQTDAKYPGKPTFPSNYRDPQTAIAHLGRYVAETTPVTFARQSFGAGSSEYGAEDASKAYLALTLGTADHLFMDLTLTKRISDTVGAVVEPTTFIFYIEGLDDPEFLLPVMIHMDPQQNGTEGCSVTIKNLPVGIYNIYEDESWCWRYMPASSVSGPEGEVDLMEAKNGDGYIRVVATTLADKTPVVIFTNGIENVRWLSDALYMPFLTPAKVNAATAEDEEENE